METKRLLLRPFQLQDSVEVFRLNANEEVMKYLPDDEVYTREDEAAMFLGKYLEMSKDWAYARWAVVRKEDNALLGWCGLREQPDGETDLGFRFHHEYWGRGYATESGRAWVDYGFGEAGLERIVANAADENIGSQRVLVKLGFNRLQEEDHHEDGFFWKRFEIRTVGK
ncbi:MAG: RimJ/RimL family protein N-acetyltransferase [Neolewinella sp.]|jgi:RimJ/RimL family protein N-acetyltransferase